MFVEMSAPTSLRSWVEVPKRSSFGQPGRAVVEYAERDRFAHEPLGKTVRRANGLRWIDARRALDKVLVCWVGVLVAVLVVLAVS
jgi:hypothetical protein